MAEAAHSKWSASGFEQVMLCPGSKVLQAGLPNTSSKYAAEGTAAHQVLTWALQESKPASAYIERVIEADGFVFVVDEDMARHVQVCIDYVQDLAGDDGIVFADIRVNYSSYLGVPHDDAWGTADVIIARGDEIITVDLKYGMGVEVSAGQDTRPSADFHDPYVPKPNPQMALYALGALQAYNGIAGDFTRVRMAISQPRIKTAPSEYDLSVDELEAWGRSTARSAVNSALMAASTTPSGDVPATDAVWFETYLRPGEKQCKFCRAKATCPALRAEVAGTVFEAHPADPHEFARLDTVEPVTAPDDCANWLAACLAKVDLIEDWCKAVRAETERRLLAGAPVPGYKLVQGKKGHRQWVDAKAAEEALKAMRVKLEDMYDLKLISPTSAEKLAKAEKLGPRQWAKVQTLITQSEGKPHVAPASDPRAALDVRPVVEEFENIVDDLA